jgi:glycosyltransferase involved in cell wall biosynthesis
MSETAIDVITPVLDGAELLEACVESVQRSRYPALNHVLAVDSRCRDGSIELAQRLAAKYPNVRFLLDQGTSAAAAINHGVAESTGEIVTWLGHDNTWADATPWIVHESLGTKPGIDFLTGAVVILDESGDVERKRFPLPGLDFIDLYFSQFIPAQEGCFWRRRIHQPLEEQFRSAFDYDLWLRLFANEIKVASTNRTLAHFRKRPGQLSASESRYAAEMNQARMEFAARCTGAAPTDFSARWPQLDFLLRDERIARRLAARKAALSPRIDRMGGAVGEFYLYMHGPGEVEFLSAQVEARLITVFDQSGPLGAVKVRGSEGRFQLAVSKPGFYFVDLTARGKDKPAACRLRCDELRWNGELVLQSEDHRAVSPDCPIYRLL